MAPGFRPAASAGSQYVGWADPRLGTPQYDQELAELRRQQAEFVEVRRRQEQQNGWMPAYALAPVAAVLAASGIGVLAGRSALTSAPLLQREIRKRGGHTPEIVVGNRAHRILEAPVRGRRDWKVEQTYPGTTGNLRPDLYNPRWGYVVEIKPNTPSGLRRGTRQLERYVNELPKAKRGRIWPYDPKDPRWR